MSLFDPKEELEQLEFNLMSLIHGIQEALKAAKDPIYEYYAVDGEMLERIVEGLVAAASSIGAIATYLNEN